MTPNQNAALRTRGTTKQRSMYKAQKKLLFVSTRKVVTTTILVVDAAYVTMYATPYIVSHQVQFSRTMELKSKSKVGLVAALVVLLVAGVVVGGTKFAEASSKKGKIAVDVVNFRIGERKVEYTVYSDKPGDEIGHKVFDFWKNEIDEDYSHYTVTVSFSTKGVHKNDIINTCVQELDFDTGGHCDNGVKYKPGKKLHTTISLDTGTGNTNEFS